MMRNLPMTRVLSTMTLHPPHLATIAQIVTHQMIMIRRLSTKGRQVA